MPSAASVLRLSALILLAAPALSLRAQQPAEPAAQPSATQATGALSLEECVGRAMQKNFDLKIETFNVQNAGESLKIADAEFVPTFNASISHSKTGGYVSGIDSKYTDSRAGVSQKFGSGAVFNLSTSLDRSANNNPLSSASLNPAYNADLSLAVTQPLLKNFGTATNKAAQRRAALGVTRAGLDYRGSVLDVINSVENAYFNLCYAREQLTVRQHGRTLSERLLFEAKARRESGVVTDLDVLQAEVGVATAQRSILLAEQSVRDRQDALLALIGQFELDSQLGAVSFPAQTDEAPTFDLSYKLARENQPDYLSTEVYLKQLQIDTESAKRNRLPSLDLDSAVGYNTTEGSAGRALREIPGSDGYSWQVGLSFRMPWGLKAENARYRSTLNSLSQGRARLQQLEQSLMVQVRAAVRSVHTNMESVQIAAKATRLSERKFEMEKDKFSAGTSTARRVLEAKDDLENALVDELQSKVALRVALSALHRLEGSSLAQYRITLP
jgi:outer membrane protein TolC